MSERVEPPAEHRGMRWHWLAWHGGEPHPVIWADENWWFSGGTRAQPEHVGRWGYRYLAPCIPPEPPVDSRRPPRWAMDDALRVLRREVRECAEAAEANRERASVARTPEIAAYLIKVAAQREQRAARLARVLAWLEGVRG